ncbi:methyltransferase domain-containing protein [Labedella endophytica]|uniref:Methyltransferase domain-containing protein n=1 Tax=Labedella endophytica TaxID=1523160 RepID=A0A433JXD6_9MICO|nr:methyltransferase domain-containing protein [Labedella endophytica]RUR03648.1 methyltransferase domain-containing protein [Labedella endophytica]
MAPSLRHRAVELAELMDDPSCDQRALERTYARFGIVNGLVSGWRRLYRERIRPLAPEIGRGGEPLTILDIGFGGGDVPVTLARWAARDHVDVRITAIDPDDRAFAFATARAAPDTVSFRRATSSDLVAAGERFDVVLSNHVLHHLDAPALAAVLADSERLARRLAVHNDIERGRLAYTGYQIGITPLAPGSFLRTDGLRSVRRSYTLVELADAVPVGWRVERQSPFRLLALFDGPRSVDGDRS